MSQGISSSVSKNSKQEGKPENKNDVLVNTCCAKMTLYCERGQEIDKRRKGLDDKLSELRLYARVEDFQMTTNQLFDVTIEGYKEYLAAYKSLTDDLEPLTQQLAPLEKAFNPIITYRNTFFTKQVEFLKKFGGKEEFVKSMVMKFAVMIRQMEDFRANILRMKRCVEDESKFARKFAESQIEKHEVFQEYENLKIEIERFKMSRLLNKDKEEGVSPSSGEASEEDNTTQEHQSGDEDLDILPIASPSNSSSSAESVHVHDLGDDSQIESPASPKSNEENFSDLAEPLKPILTYPRRLHKIHVITEGKRGEAQRQYTFRREYSEEKDNWELAEEIMRGYFNISFQEENPILESSPIVRSLIIPGKKLKKLKPMVHEKFFEFLEQQGFVLESPDMTKFLENLTMNKKKKSCIGCFHFWFLRRLFKIRS